MPFLYLRCSNVFSIRPPAGVIADREFLLLRCVPFRVLFRLVAVVLHVRLGRFPRMVCGVYQMTMSAVSMVAGGLMVAVLVMARGFAVVLGGVFVMFGCFVMVFRCNLRHGYPLRFAPVRARGRKAKAPVLREHKRGVKVEPLWKSILRLREAMAEYCARQRQYIGISQKLYTNRGSK